MLQGFPSNHTEQMPICGLTMSFSFNPVAKSIACDAPWDLGPVKRELYLFNTTSSLPADALPLPLRNATRENAPRHRARVWLSARGREKDKFIAIAPYDHTLYPRSMRADLRHTRTHTPNALL